MDSDPNTVTAMNVNLPDSDQEQAEQTPQAAMPQAAPLLTAVDAFAAADTLILQCASSA